MTSKTKTNGIGLEKRRKLTEWAATFGLLLICAALVAPFSNPENPELPWIFKWIYSGGALIYTVARSVGVNVPSDSMRLRRLRRMEFWAGVAFVIAAAFWFYSESHLGPYAGVLAVMRNTIMFTLVGAMLQIISSWMISSRAKKEQQSK
ncbi:MAG: hypothetical protein K2M27_12510 [Muribaculaceae bacterium]|nr:hypothetical protein [Muribaculaceae bacterium]